MHPVPVRLARGDDPVLRLGLRARVLVGGVLEVGTPEILARLLGDGDVEERQDLVLRVRHILRALLPLGAVLLVQVLQVRHDEGILGTEEGVEGRLGHIRLTEDAVDADDAYPLGGEQVGG